MQFSVPVRYFGLICLPWCFLLSRKLACIILRKIGRVGGDDGQVWSRVRHILSKIDSRIAVDVAEVHASFSLTIYELILICFSLVGLINTWHFFRVLSIFSLGSGSWFRLSSPDLRGQARGLRVRRGPEEGLLSFHQEEKPGQVPSRARGSWCLQQRHPGYQGSDFHPPGESRCFFVLPIRL